MGYVDDGLDEAFIGHVADFVDEERQNDGGREGEEHLENSDGYGVAQHAQEGGIVEEGVEVLEANPLAAPDSVHQLVLS